jgi:hypothetical protein
MFVPSSRFRGIAGLSLSGLLSASSVVGCGSTGSGDANLEAGGGSGGAGSTTNTGGDGTGSDGGGSATGGSATGGSATGGSATGGSATGGSATGDECDDGTFDDDGEEVTPCKAWSECSPGQYVSEAGTATTDRTCDACESGTFSALANSTNCAVWTECTVEVTAGTATSDRVCASEGWARQFAIGSADAVIVDASGNVFVAGGNGDAILYKYDGNGGLLWSRQFGTTSGDELNAVSVDASGSIYVSGTTLGNLVRTNLGEHDAIIRKYDAAGTALWTLQDGSNDDTILHASAIDPEGNLLVAGSESNGISGGIDAFLQKYDSDGNVLWSRWIGTVNNDSANAIGTDAEGNVFVAGTVRGALSGQTHLGSEDAFLRKYDPAGAVVWTREFGTTVPDYIHSLSVDESGDVVVSGQTEGTLPSQTSAGSYDAFVRKYAANGDELWTHQLGTSAWDYCLAVTTDATGRVYVAASVDAALLGQIHLGMTDAVVRRYASDGTEEWTSQFGTSDTEWANAVAVDAAGSVFVAGSTNGTLPGQTFIGGSFDAFVIKLVP